MGYTADDFDAVGGFKVNGTEVIDSSGEIGGRSPTEIGKLLECVTANYKVVTAVVEMTATKIIDLSSNLSSVVAVLANVKSATAPTTAAVSWGASGTTLTLYGWKHTSTATPTLVAADASQNVCYWAVGARA